MYGVINIKGISFVEICNCNSLKWLCYLLICSTKREHIFLIWMLLGYDTHLPASTDLSLTCPLFYKTIASIFNFPFRSINLINFILLPVALVEVSNERFPLLYSVEVIYPLFYPRSRTSHIRTFRDELWCYWGVLCTSFSSRWLV